MVKNKIFVKNYFTAIIISSFIYSCVTTSVNRGSRFSQEEALNPTCQNIMDVAQYWLGVPYLYGGDTMHGVDCSGFVQVVFQETFNIELPRTTEEMYSSGNYIRDNVLNCGDLLFFKNIRGRGVDHVGIYIGNNKFVHASSSQGVTISDFDSDYYQEHFVSARRYF